MSWLQNLFTPANQPNFSLLSGSLPTNLLNYDPSQIAPTQSSLLGGIGGLSQYNLGGMNLGQAQSIGQNMLGNWGAPGALGGAMTAAGLGESAAANQFGAGGAIYGQAFDPQQQLYNRLIAQNTDQARANATAAGLGTTPVGASSVDWANQNFNINWQNAQLQRMMQGAQSASGLQAGAAPLFMQSAMYPWQTAQGIGGANLGTLNQLGALGIQGAQIPGQQIAGWQNALGTMGNLQQQAYNQQAQNWQDQLAIMNAQQAQSQQNYQNMVQGLTGIGGMIGSAAGFGGGLLSGMQGGGGGTGWGSPAGGGGFGYGGAGPFGGYGGYGGGFGGNPYMSLGYGLGNMMRGTSISGGSQYGVY